MRVVAGLGLLGALALRVALVLRLSSPTAEWTGDARVYLRTAEALRQFEWLPEAWIWPPGYALGGLLLSPVGGLGPGLLAASVLGGLLLPALVFWLGRRFDRPTEGTIAAAILAFTPEALLASTLALSDTFGLALALGSLAAAASAPSRWRSPVAGLLAGWAALTRPETLLATVTPWVVRAVRGRPVAAAIFAGSLAVVLMPYVVGLQQASGTWSLTLKTHWNLAKFEAYNSTLHYGDGRAAWGAAIDDMRDESGALDARQIAAAAAPGTFFTSGVALRHWLGHVAEGATRVPRPVLALALLGLIGLAVPGPGRRAAGWLALSALPFLAVPLFVHPVGRFTLPLFPAVAWGLGRGLALVTTRASVRIAPRAVLVLAAGIAVLGGLSAWQRADRQVWTGQRAEIEAALRENQTGRALELLARSAAPEEERWRYTGRAQSRAGDRAAAEQSFRRAMEAGDAPLELARHLAQDGRSGEALALLDADRPDGPDPAYWSTRGNLELIAAAPEQALASFDRALREGGPAGELLYNRGVALLRLQRAAAAAASFEEAARRGPPAISSQARRALEALRAQP